MTLSLTSDFETLAKTFDLETSGTKASATMIFQLLLLKHGRRNAFAWYDHENCFGGDPVLVFLNIFQFPLSSEEIALPVILWEL